MTVDDLRAGTKAMDGKLEVLVRLSVGDGRTRTSVIHLGPTSKINVEPGPEGLEVCIIDSGESDQD